MKIQIGILVLLATCHLVKSNCLPGLTALDNDLYAYDEDSTELLIANNDTNTVANEVRNGTSTGSENKTLTDGGDHDACIIGCNLTTKKPFIERCDKKQLIRNCKTRHNKCRCFKVQYMVPSNIFCESSTLSSSVNVRNSSILSGFVIVIYMFLS